MSENSVNRLIWMPAVVTLLVLSGFFGIVVLVLLKQLHENSMLFGSLTTMASGVVAYWVGTTNSASTARNQYVDLANKAAESVSSGIAQQLMTAAGLPPPAPAAPATSSLVAPDAPDAPDAPAPEQTEQRTAR